MQVDPVTGSQFSVDVWHALIHAERLWHSPSGLVNVAASGDYYFLLRNSTNVSHARYTVDVNKECIVYLYENPTVTDAGTGVGEVNRDRESTATTGVTCFIGSTIAADGTLLDNHILGSAAGGGAYGDNLNTELEWNFKASEDYIVKVTVLNNDTDITFSWTWYEEL